MCEFTVQVQNKQWAELSLSGEIHLSFQKALEIKTTHGISLNTNRAVA